MASKKQSNQKVRFTPTMRLMQRIDDLELELRESRAEASKLYIDSQNKIAVIDHLTVENAETAEQAHAQRHQTERVSSQRDLYHRDLEALRLADNAGVQLHYFIIIDGKELSRGDVKIAKGNSAHVTVTGDGFVSTRQEPRRVNVPIS